jgi:hypothetical protein
MASKKYAYYNKGNKIGLVEKSYSGSSGNLAVAHCTISGYTTSSDCEAAGGQWIPGSSGGLDNYGKYLSPTERVADGLEIEYTYAPTYNLQSTGTEGTDFHRFIGWGSDGTNLLLFTYGVAAVADLSGIFAADDWILIKGSGRWSGLHQVKSTGGSTGILTLKTKCNLKPSTISIVGSFANIGGIFNGDNAAADMDIEAWKDLQSTRKSPYIFVDVAVDAENNGIFEVSYPTTSGQIDFTNKITIDADGDYTSTTEGILDEDADTVTIYNMFYEQISVYEGVEVMQDESFELDISHQQAQAIVYYLRAKMFEEMGDLERREFYLREFRRAVEKSSTDKRKGYYRIQGHGMIR